MTTLNAASGSSSFELLARFDSRDRNMVFSPWSVYTLLALLSAGAAGGVQKQLEAIVGDYRLYRSVNDGPMNSVNAICTHTPLKAGYATTARKLMGAEIFEAEDGTTLPSIVNEWVREQTRGEIDGILDSGFQLDFGAVLLNAVYFASKWNYPFELETTERIFKNTAKKLTSIQMMRKPASYAYFESELFQAVKIPYAGDNGLAMIVMLPERLKTLRSVIEHFRVPDNWEMLLEKFRGSLEPVDVILPRWTVSFDTILDNVLMDFGLNEMYHNMQAFWKIQSDFSLGALRHRAKIRVDEEGAVSSAVTSGIIAVGVRKYRLFQASRPFLYAIVDQENRLQFMGIVRGAN